MNRESGVVVAAVPRDALSLVLTAVHRGGYGHRSRVIDPARGNVAGQLTRAGVPVPEGFAPTGDEVVLLISAAARSTAATQLVLLHGARRAWLSDRPAEPVSPLASGFKPRPSRRAVPASAAEIAAD